MPTLALTEPIYRIGAVRLPSAPAPLVSSFALRSLTYSLHLQREPIDSLNFNRVAESQLLARAGTPHLALDPYPQLPGVHAHDFSARTGQRLATHRYG